MEEWGVGKEAQSKAWGTTKVGEETVELIHGEHPHSRSDNSIYARWPDGSVEGFDGHRLLHEIRFTDYNYLKTSGLSGNEVRKGGKCDILINGRIVDTFFYRDVMEALLSARSRLTRIHDFCIALWDEKEVDKIVGRKVYWKDRPAIVKYYFPDQAAVVLVPDPTAGCEAFSKSPWEIEDDFDDNEPHTSIKDEIWSPHIWWWRDD